MDIIFVMLVSAAAAALTLFSGFGLGTILTPVFAIYLPIETAVAATAVVHLANNVFKLGLIGRWASREVVIGFGLAAVAAAFVGAWLLVAVADLPALHRYSLWGREAVITPVKLVVGLLIAGFALAELWLGSGNLSIAPRWLPLGGLLSGFFGGLSGHQGALRSAFLLRMNLSKEALLGSGAVIAVMVDTARLLVYGWGAWAARADEIASSRATTLAATSVVAAFIGSYIGATLVQKVTIESLRLLIAGLMLLLGGALIAGVV